MFLVLVTLISVLVAVIMTVIAWRVSQEERRRSEARVASLAADIHTIPGGPYEVSTDLRPRDYALGAHAAPAGERAVVERSARRAETESRVSFGMFAAPSAAPAGTRLAVVAVIGVIVFGSAAAVAVVLGRGAAHGKGTAEASANKDAAAKPVSQRTTPNPPAAPPLELIALGHERDGDRLIVRGVIRNPPAAAAVDHVTAVVFLFNGEGGFVSSGRAAIESAALAPGAESPFVVTIRGATGVARYRVSFRTDDRVLPHVDRRDQLQAKG
jgi:hypothetical protein